MLDLLLTEMEDRRGKLVVFFAGYQKDMETKVLAYNPGLPSRFPHQFTFADFADDDLAAILRDMVEKQLKLKLCPRDGDKHVRIAARRLGMQCGTEGFGNAHAVRNLWELICRRQAERIVRERGNGNAATAATQTFFKFAGRTCWARARCQSPRRLRSPS